MADGLEIVAYKDGGQYGNGSIYDQIKNLKNELSAEYEQEFDVAERLGQIELTNLKKQKELRNNIFQDALKHGKLAAHAEMNEKLKAWEAEQKKEGKWDAEKQRAKKKQLEKEYKERLDKEKAFLKEVEKEELNHRKRKEKLEADASAKASRLQAASNVWAKGKTLAERAESLKDGGLVNALASLAQKLDNQVDTIASYKSAIDTRLQGSNNKTKSGSYWDAMSLDLTGKIGVSPLVKQDAVAKNLSTLVSTGVSFNVEQRALLMTLKDKIATTFNAQDGTLSKLVRIQAADSTAARLGMESALTSFLNRMYETTEYMQGVASNIRANLYEAEALMSATNATTFEYQVQKWMGSLYSLGMSEGTVGSISSTLGKLASGQISGLTSGGTSNLLLMAANKAGISISNALSKGLDESETNTLMKSMVSYLQGIYKQSGGSNLLLQQYASVYGLSASDIRAAANMSTGAMTGTYGSNATYGGLIKQLTSMANSMYRRTSIGELAGNAWSNIQYGTSAGIANNPVLYALYKTANLLDAATGGIGIGSTMVAGTGYSPNTTVANLMRAGALGGSILSGIAKLTSAISNGGNGGLTGAGLLNAFGIDTSGSSITILSGANESAAGYIGNSNSEDIINKTTSDEMDKGSKEISAKQDDNETKLSTVDEHIIQIYRLLQDVITGSSALHVINRDGVMY